MARRPALPPSSWSSRRSRADPEKTFHARAVGAHHARAAREQLRAIVHRAALASGKQLAAMAATTSVGGLAASALPLAARLAFLSGRAGAALLGLTLVVELAGRTVLLLGWRRDAHPTHATHETRLAFVEVRARREARFSELIAQVVATNRLTRSGIALRGLALGVLTDLGNAAVTGVVADVTWTAHLVEALLAVETIASVGAREPFRFVEP